MSGKLQNEKKARRPLNLSRYQFAMLRRVEQAPLTMEDARWMAGGTLGSLLYRGLLQRAQSDLGGRIFLSARGRAELDAYRSTAAPTRKSAAELTSRCVALLKAAGITQGQR